MDATIVSDNPRERIGGNNPPEEPKTLLDRAREGYATLSAAIADLPVIQNEDDARTIKGHIDQLKSYYDELEAERDGKVRPLNNEVAEINGTYRPVRDPIDTLRKEAQRRLGIFLQAEEERRAREAEAARQAAIETEAKARAAESREAEAIENADQGECTDVGAAIAKADEAFDEFKRADRFAKRAERDAHVKIGGGFGRSASLRTKESLEVVDAKKAIASLLKAGPLPEKLAEAILSAARDYRKVKGKLPDGVVAHNSRGL